MSSTPIHKTPIDAWRYLLSKGGVELDGRDEGLDDRIRRKIDFAAPTLEAALHSATIEAFTRAFFESVHAYADMMRSICAMFEKADARQSKHQWNLAIDGVPATLEHFRQWILTWESVPYTLLVPGIDWQGAWAWRNVIEDDRVSAAIQASFNQPNEVPRLARSWINAYRQDRYEPFPPALSPTNCATVLEPLSSVLWAAISLLRERGLTRNKLLDQWRAAGHPQERGNGLDLGSIAQNETDFWLGSSMAALAALNELPEQDLAAIGGALNKFFARYPRSPFNGQIVIEQLEAILSLPIWQKRHELYAVWIATQIIEGIELAGHEFTIHHNDGRMEFAFKETVIATIYTREPNLLLVTERRSPLVNPRGHGRVGSVQPDYGIWTSGGHASCVLVVECKHYKRAAKRRFAEVLDDYARAMPAAQVILVNHGPTGSVWSDISTECRDRCNTIEDLHPSHFEARDKLWKAVKKCVGAPVVLRGRRPEVGETAALAIDVSASMKPLLHSGELLNALRWLAKEQRVETLYAIDTEIRGIWSATKDNYGEVLGVDGADSTELLRPTNEIFVKFQRIIVVTDDDGLRSIARLAPAPLDCPSLPAGARAVLCIRTP